MLLLASLQLPGFQQFLKSGVKLRVVPLNGKRREEEGSSRRQHGNRREREGLRVVMASHSNLQAIRYSRGSLQLLDQVCAHFDGNVGEESSMFGTWVTEKIGDVGGESSGEFVRV